MTHDNKIPKGGGLYTPYAFFDLAPSLGLNPTDILVIQHLMRHRWHQKSPVFPSQELLAQQTGLSIRTVKYSLNKLVKKKLIKKEWISRALLGETGVPWV